METATPVYPMGDPLYVSPVDVIEYARLTERIDYLWSRHELLSANHAKHVKGIGRCRTGSVAYNAHLNKICSYVHWLQECKESHEQAVSERLALCIKLEREFGYPYVEQMRSIARIEIDRKLTGQTTILPLTY